MNEKIKPCPFCGTVGEVSHYDGGWFGDDIWIAACPNDMCVVAPWTDPFDTMEDAVTAWNTRTECTSEIVHCKDCIHYSYGWCSFGYPSYPKHPTIGRLFCAWGERKDNERNC